MGIGKLIDNKCDVVYNRENEKNIIGKYCDGYNSKYVIFRDVYLKILIMIVFLYRKAL